MNNTNEYNGVKQEETDDALMGWEGTCLFLRMTTVGLDNIRSCPEVSDTIDGQTSTVRFRRSAFRKCKVFLIEHIREADIARVAAKVGELLQREGFRLTEEAAVMVTRRYWDDAVDEVVADGVPESRVVQEFLNAVALPSFKKR